MATLYTIGYERHTPETLVRELRAAGVARVLDVRYRPQSRRPGMSKTKLGQALATGGIAYEPRRELGTPPDIRPLFREGELEAGAVAFRRHLEETTAAALDALADELVADGPPTALLCLEADAARCHRRVVAEAIAHRAPRLRVVDL